jgi:5-methylcytosine-specific restriction enzyme subunit McrC
VIDVHDGVTVVDCVEYGHIDIDASLWLSEGHETKFNSEIDGRDILRANFRKGVLRLQATSYVGVIPLNDHAVVRVKPRVPIANLTRMVIETGHSVLPLATMTREYSGRGTADDWAMDIYTDALLDYVDELLDEGLLRAYERRESEGHFPHGRIDLTRTVQRFAARGVDNKVAYTWFERTVDAPPNQCVKAAMEVIHGHLTKGRSKPRKGDRVKLARLAGQFHAFDEVSDDADYRFLDDPQVLGLLPLPDSRAYYRPVLDLSLVILQGLGLALELGGSDVRLRSLLIDTNKLFENFVRVSLAKHAVTAGWPVEVVDGNAETGRVDLYDIPDPLPAPLGTPLPAVASRDPGKAQPDVALRALDGTFPLIAEVKNTIHGISKGVDTLPDRGEVEQAVIYALRYDLPFTLLIHPWSGGTKGLVYVGRIRSVDVYDFRLDLSTDEGTDAALADMANAVASLAGLDTNQAPTSA